jgi:SAM-dependent methyltransferase
MPNLHLDSKPPLSAALVELPGVPGILATQDIIQRGVVGVGAAFRDEADIYDERYYNPSAQRDLLRLALHAAGLNPGDISGPVLDLGCGSGNATFAILGETRKTHVYATDLSPEMLYLLEKRAKKLGLGDRVTPFVANAENLGLTPSACSLIVGSSMAHHMMRPEEFLLNTLKALRLGGVAYFLEPFQAGHFVLRQAMSAIVRIADVLKHKSAQIDFLRRYLFTIQTMMKESDRDDTLYEAIEDKWMFPRSLFLRVGERSGCETTIFSVSPPEWGFKEAIYDLIYKGTGEHACLPHWADEFLSENDTLLTPGLREELLSVGCVVFHRR